MQGNISFAIHTLGCKVNQYESEKIAGELERLGWAYVDSASAPDIYIINSCTVTSVANHKSRQLIRRAIKGNPDALVIVAGCYADSDREEIEKIGGVGLIVGNEQKRDLPRLLVERLGASAKAVDRAPDMALDSARNANELNTAATRQKQHTRSLIKVQDGCNNFCTYCIVPHVRGDLWSRPADDVVAEVRELANMGTQEIVLTGIHLGLYGAGIDTDLGGLLAKLVDIPGLGRIRLSSIELNEVSPQIMELIATSGKVANHLHIPLQSGSDRILSRMNRHYTAEEFIKRTDELKERIPNLAMTTDVIVGFPGETEVDFEDTLKLIERVEFSKLHVFKFSPRRGTPAAGFDDQVTGPAKDARSAALIDAGKALSDKFASRYVGETLQVLVERRQGDYLSGVSDNYIRVYAEGPGEIIGKIVDVVITRQEESSLHGRII